MIKMLSKDFATEAIREHFPAPKYNVDCLIEDFEALIRENLWEAITVVTMMNDQQLGELYVDARGERALDHKLDKELLPFYNACMELGGFTFIDVEDVHGEHQYIEVQ